VIIDLYNSSKFSVSTTAANIVFFYKSSKNIGVDNCGKYLFLPQQRVLITKTAANTAFCTSSRYLFQDINITSLLAHCAISG
jgi:hypothetical protein